MDPTVTLSDLFSDDPDVVSEAGATMRGWLAAGGWMPTDAEVYGMCLRREVSIPKDWRECLETWRSLAK